MQTSDTIYTSYTTIPAVVAGQQIQVVTKPGLFQWDQITPTAMLLAENVRLEQSNRVLLMGCGHGATAASIWRRFVHIELWVTDSSIIAIECTRRTLAANNLPDAPHAIAALTAQIEPASHTGFFDAILMDLPKGRKLSQRWLVEAYNLLRFGGRLYIAGANQHGVQSVLADAQSLFGNMGIMAYKKGCRLGSLVKNAPALAPDWASSPGVAPGTWLSFPVNVGWATLQIRNLPGVFSSDHLDEGSALLLQHLDILPGGRILDVGCGCGILGLAVARAEAGAVDLVDSSLLAITCCAENIATNQITNARALPSDLLQAVQNCTYDQIISNPPFHTGQQIDFAPAQALIQQAHTQLAPAGQLWLVANRFLRYEQLMRPLFAQVEIVAQNNHFHIIRAIR